MQKLLKIYYAIKARLIYVQMRNLILKLAIWY